MDFAALRGMLKKMANSEIRNYVVPGLSSVLIGGDGFGKVRMFKSERTTREFITPHSHRFDFTCLVLRGSVTNILFDRVYSHHSGEAYCIGNILAVNGGMGSYEMTRADSPSYWTEKPTEYSTGDTYSMLAADIHSIVFSRDAEVLFFEGPEKTDVTTVLEPWTYDGVVPTFETRSWMFQRKTSA